MPALQQFFDAERKRQGWSMREMARRARISPSKAYAITKGDDNVEFETFESIALAFNMSPAELAVAIGKGPAGADVLRAPIHAVLRDVPDDQLGTVETVARALAVKPITGGKRRTLTVAKKQEALAHELTNGEVSEGAKGRLRTANGKLHPVHAAHWFSPKGMYRGLADAVLAMFLPNRDSGPLTAGA